MLLRVGAITTPDAPEVCALPHLRLAECMCAQAYDARLESTQQNVTQAIATPCINAGTVQLLYLAIVCLPQKALNK